MENEGGGGQGPGYSLKRERKVITTRPSLIDISKLNNSRIEDDSEEKFSERPKCYIYLWNKISKNIHLILAVLSSILCYYFYIFVP